MYGQLYLKLAKIVPKVAYGPHFCYTSPQTNFFIDALAYCNLQVLLCTEIAVQEDFSTPTYDFWKDLGKGGAKNVLGSLSLAMFYVPLRN